MAIGRTLLRVGYRERPAPTFILPYIRGYKSGYKRIFGSTVDEDKSEVTFPAYAPLAAVVVEDMEKVFPGIPWSDEALAQLSYSSKASRLIDSTDEDAAITESCVLPPYDHQLIGVKRALYYPRYALFYHPGLGKSKVAIDTLRILASSISGILASSAERVNTLILVPSANLTLNWAREFTQHCTVAEKSAKLFHTYPFCNVRGSSLTKAQRAKLYTKIESEMSAREGTSQHTIIMMSYDTFVNDSNNLSPACLQNLDVAVLDESHLLMSPKSKRTLSILKNLNTPRRLLLSGTPNSGDPLHIYGQLRFLEPAILSDNVFRFKLRYHILETVYRCSVCYTFNSAVYSVNEATKKTMSSQPRFCRSCNASRFKRVMLTEGYKNLVSLAMLTDMLCLRKRQEDCLDLPERRFIDINYKLDKATKASYNEIVNGLVTKVGGKEVTLARSAERTLRMLQILNGFLAYKETSYPHGPDFPVYKTEKVVFKAQPRITALASLLDSILVDYENKVIIWDWFIASMDLVEDYLISKKIGYVRVDGSTKGRTVLKDKFNNDPDCRVYLSQISTGIGITINAANFTIYAGWTYDLKLYKQSLERNYRIGQKRSVTVYRLLVEGSVHEALRAVLETKEGIAEAITNKDLCFTCKEHPGCILSKIQPFTPDCLVCPDKLFKVKSRPALL